MSFLRQSIFRLLALLGHDREAGRLDEELREHFERLVEENRRKGMPGEQARAAARRSLGHRERIREAYHDQRSLPWVESLLQDLRFGLRMLLRNPGFATVAIATLALGIGANTVIFSVVNAVVLHPLPYHAPDRLVIVQERISKLTERPVSVPAPDVLTFQQKNRVFTAAAGYQDEFYDLTGGGRPRRIRAARVSWTLFPVLDVQPLVGRAFRPEEDDPGRKVVVLGYALWKQQFGGDRSIVGRAIALDRKPYTVVGVMPANFAFPIEGLENFDPAELWLPMSFTAEERAHFGDNFNYGLLARLKPGVSLARAKADASLIAAGIEREYPPEVRNELNVEGVVTPLLDAIVGDVRALMTILLGAVGLVLLVACANVAILLLARTLNRRKEIALRMALGAGRARLLRQFITEVTALALASGVLALAIAYGGDRALVRLVPAEIPRARNAGLDFPVLLFTLALSILAAWIVGAAPAIAASDSNVNEALKEGARGASSSRRHQRIRSVLVTSEIALALLLLAGAGLLIRSFLRARQVNPGFQPEHVLSFNVALPSASYPQPEQVRSFYRQLRSGLAGLPGVRSAGFSTDLPMMANWNHIFTPEDYHPAPNAPLNFCVNSIVSDGYFDALRIPLLRGRTFNDGDTLAATPVVIISQAIAERYWPGQNPIGKRLKWGVAQSRSPWLTVAGVVGEVKQGPLDSVTQPHTYEPYSQASADYVEHIPSMYFAIRASGDPAGLAAAVRTEVWSLDSQLAIYQLGTMTDVVDSSLTPRRFNLFLLAGFAALALVLAVIGIYGVVSYAAGQRTHEVGLRMALGAGRADVLKLVVGQGVGLALAGIVLGVCGALVLTRFLASLLYQIAPDDPATLVAVSVLLGSVAIAACLVPAWRATRVDPAATLRSE
ncbi:MAG TPA: ABC transporter permease [Candidatus Acidoferrales bacterium]|nr:ABC transporter permease [Candidatus Acidoferrales bacterium]